MCRPGDQLKKVSRCERLLEPSRERLDALEKCDVPFQLSGCDPPGAADLSLLFIAPRFIAAFTHLRPRGSIEFIFVRHRTAEGLSANRMCRLQIGGFSLARSPVQRHVSVLR